MNCNQAQQALLLETSGEIGLWRARRLHRHLAGCPACLQWQTDLCRLEAIELPARSAPELNPARFPAALAARRSPVQFVLFPALAAALALLLAGAGWLSWSRWNVRQIEVQTLARMDRFQEWTLLAALLNGDDLAKIDLNDPANPESARQALARQLLRLQEQDFEEIAEDDGATPSAQHLPTALPRHNRIAGLSEKYG
jgi:hypothetical protein